MRAELQTTAAAPRVRIVQAESRRALRLAVVFALAAAVATVVPHSTPGAWLPLHLFLVGALGLAISGATRLFAVTWSAGRPSHPRLVTAQRWLLALGAAGLAAGRELGWPRGLVAAAGLCVTAALILLGALLVADVRGARVRRFHAALRYYLAAVAAGVTGTVLGALMVTGRAGLRDAHVIVNLLGFVGLVIAGTLPSFTATQARMKMSLRATPYRLGANLAWLGGSTVAAAAGALAGNAVLQATALAAYALGLVHVMTLVPRAGQRQLAWAGPRLVAVAAGMTWWVTIVAVAARDALRGDPVLPEQLVVALVIGGYAQILVASLAYLGPVLRGGGHVRLSEGFALTRSWVAVVALNVGGLAWLADRRAVTAAAIAVLAVEVTVRSLRLLGGATRPHAPEPAGV